MNRAEIESQLMNEIHYLPDEIMEAMLTLALSIKKGFKQPLISETQSTETSAGLALRNFLKKYQSEPIDIDTRIFEQNRATETDRDFRL